MTGAEHATATAVRTVPREPAEALAAFSRTCYERGWMPGTSGNLSVRLTGADSGTALITASGCDKGELTAEHMVAVGAENGAPLRTAPLRTAPLRASAETSIHAAVYRSTRAGAVIHVHSPYSTVVACRAGAVDRRRDLTLTRFELLKGLGLDDPTRTTLPVFPNWADVPRIADEIADWLRATPEAPPGLLLADHGITVWGRDLAQARNRLECLEAICQLRVLGAHPERNPAT